MNGLATDGKIIELGQATSHGLDHAGGSTEELCGGGGSAGSLDAENRSTA